MKCKRKSPSKDADAFKRQRGIKTTRETQRLCLKVTQETSSSNLAVEDKFKVNNYF